MSTLIRCYPGDRNLDFLLVVILGVGIASSAAWFISRRLAGKAALRHFVLFSALICCLATPAAVCFCAAAGLTLFSIPLLHRDQAATIPGTTAAEISAAEMPARPFTCPSPIDVESPSPPTTTTTKSSADATVACAPDQSTDASILSPPEEHLGNDPAAGRPSFHGIAAAAMLVWAAGALLMLARLARNGVRVVKLRRSARPLRNERHQSLLREVAGQLGMRPAPLLLASSRVIPPLAVGFGRPAIILPERLLGAVSDDELRDVFVHEVAHIRRRDQRVMLLQELAGALYWPIASVHALNRELREAREELCDNVVLAGRDAIRYGKTLLHVAELLVGVRPMGAALGVIGGRGKLEERISGLINPRRNIMTKIDRKTMCFVVCMFTVVGVIASATRFKASAAPPAEGPSPDAKSPAAKAAACPEPSDKEPAAKETVEARAENTKSWSFGYRHRHMFSPDSYEGSLIGGLVDNYWWKKSLPLAPAQARAIQKLDALIKDANDQAGQRAADYLDTNPADYHEFGIRVNNRLLETLRHAEQMVRLGLLTESQAALMLYEYTKGDNHLYVLRDKNIEELLGITANQIKELDKIGDAANHREALLNLWSVDPIEQEYVGTVMNANAKRMNAEALKVLTPSQRKIWDEFTAKPSLPANPPDVPVPTKAEMASIKLENVSPVFRVLTEKADAFKLSDPQKRLLNRLEGMTREGLYWISLRKSKDGAASAEFIKQAEQVALFGILTEKQAGQVESAVKKS